MGHHHGHGDDEHGTDAVPFSQKSAKLVAHWIHHNREHADSYRKWAGEFRKQHFSAAAQALEAAAELSTQIDRALRDAAACIDSHH